MLKRLLLLSVLVAIFSAALHPTRAQAQWVSDSTTNTPVCTATNIQDFPCIVSDGSDGAIVVWEDLRGDGAYIIYAQRIGADGKPMWQSNGVRLTTGIYGNQRFPVAASDGKGGAYVVWQDYRNGTQGLDLYAQHILSNGKYAYDSTGRPVAFAPGDQTNQQIVADGFGNAYVVWEDNRSTVTETNPDIYMSRLTPTRVAWDSTGVQLTGMSGKQRRPQLCEDGTGGFYAAWESTGTNPISIYGQHVDSNQHLLWTTPYGVNIYQATTGGQNAKDVCIRRDGSQVMLAWEVSNLSSTNGQDVYANRLTSAGVKLYNPIEVAVDYPGDQINPQVFSDDSAEAVYSNYPGLLVLFENSYSTYPQSIQMARFFADGTTRQPAAGKGFFQVSNASSYENGYKALRVAPGAIMTVWNDGRHDSSIYAQRVDRPLQRDFPTMNTKSTWGLAIQTRATSQSKQVVIAPRTNGLIAAWTDYRNGNADIYAQLIFKDGTLPLELTSFTARAIREHEVDLAWRTASESGNMGFEVERRLADRDAEYQVVASYAVDASLRGAGTSTIEHSYRAVDHDVEPAIYEYRLVDIAMDGTHTRHDAVRVDTRSFGAESWSIGPGVPNPFVSATEIPLTLPVEAIVDVSLLDASGRVVATPLAAKRLPAGENTVAINTTTLALLSGSYAVRVSASDPITGAVLWRPSKPLMLSVIR